MIPAPRWTRKSDMQCCPLFVLFSLSFKSWLHDGRSSLYAMQLTERKTWYWHFFFCHFLETWIVLVPRTPKLRGQLPIRADIDRKNEKGYSREANPESPVLVHRRPTWTTRPLACQYPVSPFARMPRVTFRDPTAAQSHLTLWEFPGQEKKRKKLCTRYHGFVIRAI